MTFVPDQDLASEDHVYVDMDDIDQVCVVVQVLFLILILRVTVIYDKW